jgi:hypothetical protein
MHPTKNAAKNQSNTPIRAITDFNAAMSASLLTFILGLAEILRMTVQTAYSVITENGQRQAMERYLWDSAS